eukprot:CAMPEP_0168388524 /NCGR_PEP_ID=MMETSP0228-20121227/16497_1 /TAXON_ID=133427 /ORGANISM="Protoceratium reticulatum, Strain CCCM 535 (=CCMP 1889)" /LENGTH=95 /DNA_ID=CAMNT_0008401777 /DNA_START=617 /DNA_END=904 /DNA_ORIENTATION=+
MAKAVGHHHGHMLGDVLAGHLDTALPQPAYGCVAYVMDRPVEWRREVQRLTHEDQVTVPQLGHRVVGQGALALKAAFREHAPALAVGSDAGERHR